MKPSVAITVTLLLAGASAVAAAQTNPTGFYVGASLGQFNMNIDSLDDVDDAAATIRDSDDNAWKAFVGYRFLPWLRLEAAYVDLGNPGDSFESSGSDGNYRVGMSGFEPALIASLPLGPIEIFGKVGEYFYDLETQIDLDDPGPSVNSKHSRNDFVWGGGVSAVVMSRIELRAEYERIEIENADDSDAFWLGAAWRF